VKTWQPSVWHATLVLLTLMLTQNPSIRAQQLHMEEKVPAADGWHPWYEVKSDPENGKNLIICSTRWDADLNAPFGQVYASSDAGITWKSTLEDKSTRWVTEHSCAFGPNHMAYFISEAQDSKLELGTTRLFVSTDSGQHWSEAAKTAWADFSTSAVSATSGRLYVFYQVIDGRNTTKPNWTYGSLGLLIFSPDGKKIAGPFLDSAMAAARYEGVYPTNAISLRSGAVVALYFARTTIPSGWKTVMGIVRADSAMAPILETTDISQSILKNPTECFNFLDGSLTYDPEDNKLIIVYMDGCKDSNRLLITSSADEGRTWTKSVALSDPDSPHRRIAVPSLIPVSGEGLALLWEEGLRSGEWMLSYIRNYAALEPPVEISSAASATQVSNDSLLTTVFSAESSKDWNASNPLSSIKVLVRSGMNDVWRASGLARSDGKILALWSSGDSDGMRLFSGVFSLSSDSLKPRENRGDDVTRTTSIFSKGGQRFDSETGTLTVCLALENQGNHPIRLPVQLEVVNLSSRAGRVCVLNSTNRLNGPGAVWDISDSVTGDRLNIDSATDPFCLSFHLEVSPKDIFAPVSDGLLNLDLRVVAPGAGIDGSNRKDSTQ
jgi:hypothetical protein